MKQLVSKFFSESRNIAGNTAALAREPKQLGKLGTFYKAGDLTGKSGEKPMGMTLDRLDRDARVAYWVENKQVAGEKSQYLGKLIEERVRLEDKLFQDFGPENEASNDKRATARLVGTGLPAVMWEMANWISSASASDQDKCQSSSWMSTIKTAGWVTAMYLTVYRPSKEIFEEGRQDLKDRLDELDGEIKGLVEDLRASGNEALVTSQIKALDGKYNNEAAHELVEQLTVPKHSGDSLSMH